MKNVLIRVGKMSCEHCVRAVENALKGVPGVDKVKVDLQSASAKASIDPDVFQESAAAAAIAEEGYEFGGIEEVD